MFTSNWRPGCSATIHLVQRRSPGIDEPVEGSGIWRSNPDASAVDEELSVFDSPWPLGSQDPELLWQLVEQDIKQG